MSESFVLSLIFLGIIALIGFIGANVGIARGFVLTVSILGGAELGLWWGVSAGQRLTDWFSMSESTGRFLAAMFLLLATVTLLGVAGSLVVAWGTPTRWGAILGTLLGAANGALLIAMCLRLYYLAYNDTLSNVALEDSLVARVLWKNFDWFILGFMAVAALLLLYTRFAHLDVTIPDPAFRSSMLRSIPPPVPRPDASVRRTQGSPSISPLANTHSPSGNGLAGSVSPHPVDDEIYAPPRVAKVPATPTTVERTTVVEVSETKIELPSARNTVRFCPNCGMTLDASDRFCPDCGFTL